jgi:hypothetical protein
MTATTSLLDDSSIHVVHWQSSVPSPTVALGTQQLAIAKNVAIRRIGVYERTITKSLEPTSQAPPQNPRQLAAQCSLRASRRISGEKALTLNKEEDDLAASQTRWYHSPSESINCPPHISLCKGRSQAFFLLKTKREAQARRVKDEEYRRKQEWKVTFNGIKGDYVRRKEATDKLTYIRGSQ